MLMEDFKTACFAHPNGFLFKLRKQAAWRIWEITDGYEVYHNNNRVGAIQHDTEAGIVQVWYRDSDNLGFASFLELQDIPLEVHAITRENLGIL